MRPNWAKKLWHRSTALRILPTPACFWPRLGARNRNPAAWARDRWPLLTAVGVFALTVVVLGAVVGSDR